jgi:hypothetical protein
MKSTEGGCKWILGIVLSIVRTRRARMRKVVPKESSWRTSKKEAGYTKMGVCSGRRWLPDGYIQQVHKDTSSDKDVCTYVQPHQRGSPPARSGCRAAPPRVQRSVSILRTVGKHFQFYWTGVVAGEACILEWPKYCGKYRARARSWAPSYHHVPGSPVLVLSSSSSPVPCIH